MSGSFFDPPIASDVLFLRNFTNHTGDGRASVTFKGAKDKAVYGMALFLGMFREGKPDEGGAGPEIRLNNMGWVYDPKRAAVEMEARLDGTYKEPEE